MVLIMIISFMVYIQHVYTSICICVLAQLLLNAYDVPLFFYEYSAHSHTGQAKS